MCIRDSRYYQAWAKNHSSWVQKIASKSSNLYSTTEILEETIPQLEPGPLGTPGVEAAVILIRNHPIHQSTMFSVQGYSFFAVPPHVWPTFQRGCRGAPPINPILFRNFELISCHLASKNMISTGTASVQSSKQQRKRYISSLLRIHALWRIK